MTKLRVFFPPYFPLANPDCSRFPTMLANKFCKWPGLLIEIITIIAKDLNITIVPFTKASFGTPPSEAVSLLALEKLVKNSTIDLIAVPLQMTDKRMRSFAFSEWIYDVKTMLIHRKREDKFANMWSFILTYDSHTWMMLFLTGFLQMIVCAIAKVVKRRSKEQKISLEIAKSAYDVLRLQLLQPSTTLQGGLTAENISLCLFGVLQCSILIGIFGSFILASIIRPQPAANDPVQILLHDLQSKERFIVTNDPFKWFYERINYSQHYPYPEIRSALADNPIQIVKTREEALKMVDEENAMLFQQEDEQMYFTAHKYCNIEPISLNMPSVKAYLMFQKGQPLLAQIDRSIKQNRLKFMVLTRKYFRRANWNIDCEPRKAFQPLQIAPYTGVLLICFLFAVVATMVFLIELFVNEWNQRIEKKISTAFCIH